MIARNTQSRTDAMDIWSRLSAPTPLSEIQWRQDGRPLQRDGRYIARFVAFVDAQFVRERLDSVVPGEWDLHLDPLAAAADPDGVAVMAFKAKLQILGVVREDVGQGQDYKAAASDAFKRAAMRFGIAHDLYRLENNWVQVDGDGKYAKPLVDPSAAYEKRYGQLGAPDVGNGHENGNGAAPRAAATSSTQPSGEQRSPAPQPTPPAAAAPNEPRTTDEPQCPACGGRMWDNRLSKRNPSAPDFKCRNRSCEGVLWPGQWPPSPLARPDQLVELMQLGKSEYLKTNTRASVDRRLAEHVDRKKLITEHQAEQTILELKNRIAAAKEKEQRETPLLAGSAAPAPATNEGLPNALKDPVDDGLPF